MLPPSIHTHTQPYAQVGSTPGVTKGLQEIHLDKHIRLLDSPGIVFASGEGAAAAALRNAIKVGVDVVSKPNSGCLQVV